MAKFCQIWSHCLLSSHQCAFEEVIPRKESSPYLQQQQQTNEWLKKSWKWLLPIFLKDCIIWNGKLPPNFNSFKQNLTFHGTYWWSSGQRACLLLWWYELKSCWIQQFSVKLLLNTTKIIEKRPRLAHLKKWLFKLCVSRRSGSFVTNISLR